MKNIRYFILEKYFMNSLETDELLNEKVENYFKLANKLYEENKISLVENDGLVNSMEDYQKFLFEFVAACPFIEFKFNNMNDYLSNAKNSQGKSGE